MRCEAFKVEYPTFLRSDVNSSKYISGAVASGFGFFLSSSDLNVPPNIKRSASVWSSGVSAKPRANKALIRSEEDGCVTRMSTSCVSVSPSGSGCRRT